MEQSVTPGPGDEEFARIARDPLLRLRDQLSVDLDNAETIAGERTLNGLAQAFGHLYASVQFVLQEIDIELGFRDEEPGIHREDEKDAAVNAAAGHSWL